MIWLIDKYLTEYELHDFKLADVTLVLFEDTCPIVALPESTTTLSVLPSNNFNEVDEIIQRYTHPLAMYIFTKNIAFGKKFLESYPFGGGAINDTVVHIVNDRLPFGGIGSSGMGKYHGKSTFETFSHYKPYISRPLWIDPPLRYPPFKNKINFMKKILKMI